MSATSDPAESQSPSGDSATRPQGPSELKIELEIELEIEPKGEPKIELPFSPPASHEQSHRSLELWVSDRAAAGMVLERRLRGSSV